MVRLGAAVDCATGRVGSGFLDEMMEILETSIGVVLERV